MKPCAGGALAFAAAQVLDIATTALGLRLGFGEANVLALRNVVWMKARATLAVLAFLAQRMQHSGWVMGLASVAWSYNLVLILGRWL